MINLTVNEKARKNNISRCREKGILIPTFEHLKHPETMPPEIRNKLANVGLWDVNPLNLFRITWKNEQKEKGGGFGPVNAIEIPPALTGVKASVVCLVGKWFPTGAHKVGATYGCLVPSLVTGNFDSTWQKAVWPSTGNFCRGGAYNSALLGCQSIAILPEGMSRERFDWLKTVAGEIIATYGCESNVKEIFDKCWELKKTRDDVVIFNQFEEFGNYLWHYEVTGSAVDELFSGLKGSTKSGKLRLSGYITSTGSAGTIAAGDFLKGKYPEVKIGASEALQCPTLFDNGFGGHRIEGIGDKHVPWIHNVRNTDMVIAIDDEDCMRLVRLFNEPEGRKFLVEKGMPADFSERLGFIGISGMANILSAIKMANYYEMTEDDVIVTILTDSMDLYKSRLDELKSEKGSYNREGAVADYFGVLMAQGTDTLKELLHGERKRIHNLKYYTWIEQQEKDINELNAMWSDYPAYWDKIRALTPEIDRMIGLFNDEIRA